MMPLSLAQTGEDVEVKDVVGGESVCKRLMEMGFNKGSIVKIIKNNTGSLIIGVGESRIVLGRGMAQKIMVYPN